MLKSSRWNTFITNSINIANVSLHYSRCVYDYSAFAISYNILIVYTLVNKRLIIMLCNENYDAI